MRRQRQALKDGLILAALLLILLAVVFGLVYGSYQLGTVVEEDLKQGMKQTIDYIKKDNCTPTKSRPMFYGFDIRTV